MSARRSQAALSMARKKARASPAASAVQYHSAIRGAVASTSASVSMVAGYNAQDDAVNLQMEIDPDAAPQSSVNIWESFSRKDKIVLVLIKLFDILFSLYLVGFVSYGLYLNCVILLAEETILATIGEEGSSNSSSEILEWFNTNLTVLGKERWSMSYGHFSLIFSIFHVVYGLIASICDILFFHSLLRNIVLERYLETVLPVHRLFFIVITSIDGLIFTFTGNITSLINTVFPIFMVVLISLIVLSDALLTLVSYEAVKGKPGLIFTKPWRNLVIIVTLLVTIINTLVSQYQEYTWDIIPVLIFNIISIIMLVNVVITNLQHVTNNNDQDEVVSIVNIFNLLMCISSTNVLGLLGIGSVLHRLIFFYAEKMPIL